MSIEDIKPDTSLYTDLPNRLRAYALVLEGEGHLIQAVSNIPGDTWTMLGGKPSSQEGAALNVADGSCDYRIRPEPREVWIMQHENDGLCLDAVYKYLPPPAPGYKAIRFVEVL